MYDFLRDMLKVFPNSFYYARKKYEIKKICKYASEREFTDIIIINEDRKEISTPLTFFSFHLTFFPFLHSLEISALILSYAVNKNASMTLSPATYFLIL